MTEKTPSNQPLPQQTGTTPKGAPTPGKSTQPSGAPSGKTSTTEKGDQRK